VSAGQPRKAEDFCYRHPDRRSYVLCQRCLRTICPECQTQAAVGVVCPECLAQQRQQTPPRVKRAARRLDSRPLVSYWIVGITAALFVVALFVPLTGFLAFNSLYLMPELGAFQPWRLFTALLAHGSFWHLALNMLAVWLIGRSLEPLLGHMRFLALYLIAGLGGSVAVALLAPGTFVIGASGAVFGLLGALLIIGRHIGANITGILVILGINLVLSFLPGSSISWQAHVGGLAVGALLGLIYARTRAASQATMQNLLVGAVAAGLVVLCAVPALT